nr:hypothetical protein [Paracoccus sanguinis]
MSDDEGGCGGFDDLGSDDRELVDAQDAVDLDEEALKEAEVSTSEAGDRGHDLGVREVVVAHFLAPVLPMALEDEGEFVLRERRMSVREADAAVELRVSGHAPLDTGRADQDQAGIAAVELVAEIFERGRGKALGFVNYDKFEAADRRG